MNSGRLLLTPFRKALSSLDDALRLPRADDIVRDATIQRFEYTYELARKMIERHLRWMGISDIESLSRRALYREAARVGLITDPEAWFRFNLARNKTSHTYSEETAREVFEVAQEFAPSARYLLGELSKVHD